MDKTREWRGKCEKRIAVARPMPDEAPVIIDILLFRLSIFGNLKKLFLRDLKFYGFNFGSNPSTR